MLIVLGGTMQFSLSVRQLHTVASLASLASAEVCVQRHVLDVL